MRHIFKQRNTWFLVFCLCNVVVVALLGYRSIIFLGQNLSEPVIYAPTYPQVFVFIRDLDTLSCSATVWVDAYVPVSFMSNVTWEDVGVEVVSILPEFQRHQNLSLDRSSTSYRGSANYKFAMASQRHLYPFDSYSIGILLRLPAWLNTAPQLVGRMSEELSGFYTAANVETEFSAGVSGGWGSESTAEISSAYVMYFTVVRPEVYRVLILTPFWTIFLVLFSAAKLDPKTTAHFVSKLSLYTGLFIFILGYAFVNAPSLSLMSDIMKFILIIILSSFIILDIIQFTDKKNKVQIERLKFSFELRDMQFIVSLVILTLLELFLVQGFVLNGLRVGFSFVLLPLIPLIVLSSCLLLLKRRIWVLAGGAELALAVSLLMRGFL